MLLQLQLPIRSATNDSYLFFPLETSGLPYVEHSVEEQSLAHQVCLKNEVFVRLTADWTEPSSAVCSGPSLSKVWPREIRNKKKEVVASWEEKHSSWSGWRIRSED